MKRVKSWLRVNAFVAPPAFFVFLHKINSRIDVLAGDSLLKVSSGRIGPTLVCVSRPTISAWRVVVCGYSGDVRSIVRPWLGHRTSTAQSFDPPEEKNGGRRVD